MKMRSFQVFVAACAMLWGAVPSVPAAQSQVDHEQTRRLIRDLVNPGKTVHLQDLRIQEEPGGHISLRIDATLGDCWGKQELAKGYARRALKALFHSPLPISHVILNLYEGGEILMKVALGRNQALNMDWEADSSRAFFETLRQRPHYDGDPADYCWLIEKRGRASR